MRPVTDYLPNWIRYLSLMPPAGTPANAEADAPAPAPEHAAAQRAAHHAFHYGAAFAVQQVGVHNPLIEALAGHPAHALVTGGLVGASAIVSKPAAAIFWLGNLAVQRLEYNVAWAPAVTRLPRYAARVGCALYQAGARGAPWHSVVFYLTHSANAELPPACAGAGPPPRGIDCPNRAVAADADLLEAYTAALGWLLLGVAVGAGLYLTHGRAAAAEAAAPRSELGEAEAAPDPERGAAEAASEPAEGDDARARRLAAEREQVARAAEGRYFRAPRRAGAATPDLEAHLLEAPARR